MHVCIEYVRLCVNMHMLVKFLVSVSIIKFATVKIIGLKGLQWDKGGTIHEDVSDTVTPAFMTNMNLPTHLKKH